jgi:3-oxoacyl-[acyl-carrier-protein] synthase-1
METHITGVGMVSSLGHDVVTACAASRAGITRSGELDYFLVRSADDPSHQGAIGHAVADVTRGFEGFARLLRITHAALLDLRRQVPDGPWRAARTGFYLSLPDPSRLETGVELLPEADREDAAANGPSEKAAPETDAERLIRTAARLAAWPSEPSLRFVSTSGHTGVAEALARAAQDLEEGKVSAAIVGGIDSLLEEPTLAWLEATGRLKTPRIAAGLQPGEAGAFLVLERKGANPAAIIRDIRFAQESQSLLSGEPPRGDGLVDALAGIASTPAWHLHGPVWIVTDHNGEQYRALEWGNAAVRLLARSADFTSPLLWYPAASFGDTGAASGAVSLCVVVRAFARRYAIAEQAAIVASADGPMRAAMLVESPRGT